MTHRPCLWLALVLAAGILVGRCVHAPWPIWLWGSVCAVLFFFFNPRVWLVYVALFCLGALLIYIKPQPPQDYFLPWRTQLKSSLNNYLDAKEAGVITAMVTGDRSDMPKELKVIFNRTGTGHIVAISGMNMAIIIAMVFFVLKLCGISRCWQCLGTIGFLFMYALLTGASPSVMRACFMASVILLGYAFEQEGEGLNSLGLAAFILLLINARNLFDIGFQLSFAAVGAIVIMYEPLKKSLSRLPEWLAAPLALSGAAWIGTAPLQLWHFGTITPIALLANIPIVPLADLTVALGLLLALAGLFTPVIALPIAGCLKIIFNVMIILAQWFSEVPYGYIQLYGK